MALQKRGNWWYGDSQADIRGELIRVGILNEYVPTEFADARCVCGCNVFNLRLDANGGIAVRACTMCPVIHPIGDNADFLADAELEECACPCDEEEFEITAGVHLYSGSEDVKWLYLGCRCIACGLVANYGDWKNEFIDYRKLLARV